VNASFGAHQIVMKGGPFWTPIEGPFCVPFDMPYCPRPKWMRRRTLRRLVGVIRECHQRQIAYLVLRWPGMRL